MNTNSIILFLLVFTSLVNFACTSEDDNVDPEIAQEEEMDDEQGETDLSQDEALIAIAEANPRSELSGLWLTDTPIENWPLIRVNDQGMVTYISLGLRNRIDSLPPSIGTLTALDTLIIDGFLQTLPSEIGQLTNLKFLNLSGNPLTELPTEMSQMTSLNSLSLGLLRENEHSLDNVLPTVYLIKSLVTLNLQKAGLNTIPDGIDNLTNLKELLININNLEQLPDDIYELSALETLTLHANDISTISSKIQSLTNLKIINLGGAVLSELPSEFSNLNKLERVFINDAGLTAIPVDALPAQLEELDLFRNEITSIPDEISNFEALEVLNLYENDLSSISSEIGEMGSLKTLGLGFNNLSTLPSEIGNLSNLDFLGLDGNSQLTSFPDELCELVNNGTEIVTDSELVCE